MSGENSATSETRNGEDNAEVRRIELLMEQFWPALHNVAAALTQAQLDLYRRRNKPWSAMIHAEQESVAHAIEAFSIAAVRKVGEVFAALSFPAAEGRCKRVTVANGASVILEFSDEFVEAVVRLHNKAIVLPLVDLEEFVRRRDELQLLLDAEAPPLPFRNGNTGATGDTSVANESANIVAKDGTLFDSETGEVVPKPGEILQGAAPAAGPPAGELPGLSDLERDKRAEHQETGRRRRLRGSDGTSTST